MRLLQSGLRTQIILNLIVLMVVTVGLISIATLKITASSILREKITSGNILVSSIQSTIDSIFQGDPESFQKGTEGWRLARLSHSFARTSELSSLLIIDREHRVMADSGNVADGAVIEWKDLDEAMSGGRVITRFGNPGKWLFWGVSDELIVFAPIYLGARIVGGIRATMPLADVQESIARTQKIILLYIVFDSIIISILGGFLLSRSIVRPIKDLLVATERISDRDFSQRMEGSNINEIGKLYMSFNRMSRRLKEYVESIEKTSVELKEVHKEVIRSEKLASVGRLAAGVAHEIGNPMGAILGYVHILGSGTTSKEEEKNYLTRIESESNRINTIVRNLLDFSRPSEVEVKDAEVNKIIEGTISLLSPQKVLRNIRVDLSLEEDLPYVRVDENQFQQVLINLIINAGDAMPEGGDIAIQTGQTAPRSEADTSVGSMSRRRKDDPSDLDYSHMRQGSSSRTVYRILRDSSRYVTIKVSDTGCGIKKEDILNVFDPFYTTKPPGKGTGLGLTTCLRIVESFNGHIRVESEEGKGTTFIILLPITKESEKC